MPDAELTALSTVPSGIVTEAFAYLVNGGPENFEHLLRFVADTVLLEGYGFDGPREIARIRRVARSGSTATASRPLVAVVFYRAHLVAGNTQFVADLCDAIEAAGADALALWCYSLREPASAGALVALVHDHGVDVLITTVLAAGGVAAGAGTTGRAGGLDGEAWDVRHARRPRRPDHAGAVVGRVSRAEWERSDRRASGPTTPPPASPSPSSTAASSPRRSPSTRWSTTATSWARPCAAYRTVPDRAARVAGIAAAPRPPAAHAARRPARRHRAVSAYPTKRSRLGNAVGLDTPGVGDGAARRARATQGYRVDDVPTDGDALMAGAGRRADLRGRGS